MAEPLAADELAAYFALRRAGDRLQRLVSAQLLEHGLTEIQFSVLAELSGAPDGLRRTDLARTLVASKSGITYQATQLERRGLLQRVGGGADERSVVARLTTAGRELIGAVLPEHVALVRATFIDLLDASELAVVGRALGRVAALP
jgi:DNA-binding MarR family transcriptional regulator